MTNALRPGADTVSPQVSEPCVLHCPKCGAAHVDEGEWATRPHHNHLCATCGNVWRVEPYAVGVVKGGEA